MPCPKSPGGREFPTAEKRVELAAAPLYLSSFPQGNRQYRLGLFSPQTTYSWLGSADRGPLCALLLVSGVACPELCCLTYDDVTWPPILAHVPAPLVHLYPCGLMQGHSTSDGSDTALLLCR